MGVYALLSFGEMHNPKQKAWGACHIEVNGEVKEEAEGRGT